MIEIQKYQQERAYVICVVVSFFASLLIIAILAGTIHIFFNSQTEKIPEWSIRWIVLFIVGFKITKPRWLKLPD